MSERYCGRCGENYEPKDAGDHRVCKRVATPPVATPMVATPLTEAEQAILKRALRKAAKVVHPGIGVESARVQKWRESNRERYNKRMREYRKKKRAGFIGIAYG